MEETTNMDQQQEVVQDQEQKPSFRDELLEKLENASPLDAFSILEQTEMYDEQEAHEIIDQVYKEFESGDNKVQTIVVPVFTSVVDGLLRSLNKGKPNTNTDNAGTSNQPKSSGGLGLSATRVVTECMNFRYEGMSDNAEVYGEVIRNERFDNYDDFNKRVGTNISAYERKKFEYKQSQRNRAMKDEKNQHPDGGILDRYQNKPLYKSKKEAIEKEGNIKNSAQYEHIIPLKTLRDNFAENCMLTDDDVRKIANMNDNMVFTSAELNQSKQDMNNKDYVKANKDKLNRETRRNMRKEAKRAQRKINKEANKAVVHNMQNPEQLKKLGKQMGNVAGDAAKEGAKMGIGNAILEVLKPLYYEMADSFKNGFVEGCGASKVGEAFKIRIGRVVNHVRGSLKNLGLGSLTDLIKNVISSIVSAIVDLFFGIVKNLLKLLQKGIPVVISAFKILFDKNRTAAERGDAAVKLIGSSLIAILGGMLIDKIFGADSSGIKGVFKEICSCLLSGCGTMLFILLMDKIDLFSAKEEKRRARINEIFAARWREMEERARCVRVEAVKRMAERRLKFDELIEGAEQAIEQQDTHAVMLYSYSLAEFFEVDLEYTDTDDFIRWWDQQEVVRI